MQIPAENRAGRVIAGFSATVRDRSILDVSEVVHRIIDEKLWQNFKEGGWGELQHFERFTDFLAYLKLEYQNLHDLCRRDPVAQDKLDQLMQNPASIHLGAGNNVTSRPEGNSQAKGLRRLRKDRPDLHTKVLAKEMTAHRAMVVAGFRQRTITVPVDVTRAAKTIRKHFSVSEVTELRERLRA